MAESLKLSAPYIKLGVAFGGFVWYPFGQQSAAEYMAAFVMEKILALENVFSITLIFYFTVLRIYQHRVVIWSILGVIVPRGIMIGVGVARVSYYSWVLHIFAVFRIATGVKMRLIKDKEIDLDSNPIQRFMKRCFNVTTNLHGNAFFVKQPNPKTGKMVQFVTFFLALLPLKFADLIFAVDSMPAVFAIITDPYIV